MQIEQQRSLGRQSMRIVGGEYEDTCHDFREMMLLHNKVEGIMKFEIINENGNKVYEYMMSPGTESLKTFCEHRKIGINELRNIFGMLLKSVYHGHEFMLHEDDYVVTPDTVYTDGKQKTEVAYFSGHGKPLREQLKKLAEFMMDYVDYQDEDAVLLVYSFYMLTKKENCTIEELVGSLNPRTEATISQDEHELTDAAKTPGSDPAEGQEKLKLPEVHRKDYIQKNDPAPDQGRRAGRENYDPVREASELADHAAFREIVPDRPDSKPSLLTVIRSAPAGLLTKTVMMPAVVVVFVLALIRFGILTNSATGRPDVLKVFACAMIGLALTAAVEKAMWKKFAQVVEESFKTAAESADEPTLLLCDDGMARFPFSLVSDEYPAIQAGRFPFFIGKDPKTSDYVLNKAGVSRYHLKIDKEGEYFTIADLCSTNGTYLNGVRLEAYRPERVKRGDEVRIGPAIYYCN